MQVFSHVLPAFVNVITSNCQICTSVLYTCCGSMIGFLMDLCCSNFLLFRPEVLVPHSGVEFSMLDLLECFFLGSPYTSFLLWLVNNV